MNQYVWSYAPRGECRSPVRRRRSQQPRKSRPNSQRERKKEIIVTKSTKRCRKVKKRHLRIEKEGEYKMYSIVHKPPKQKKRMFEFFFFEITLQEFVEKS